MSVSQIKIASNIFRWHLCDSVILLVKIYDAILSTRNVLFWGNKILLSRFCRGWSQTARIVNSQVLSLYRLRNYRFVTANKTLGHPSSDQSSSQPDTNIDKHWQPAQTITAQANIGSQSRNLWCPDFTDDTKRRHLFIWCQCEMKDSLNIFCPCKCFVYEL